MNYLNMNYLVIFLFGLICYIAPRFRCYDEAKYSQDWIKFKDKHNKSYKDPNEDVKRYNVFLKNKELIQNHNNLYEKGQASFKVKLSNFADFFENEFHFSKNFNMNHNTVFSKYELSLKQLSKNKLLSINQLTEEIPDSMDWHSKGCVTDIRNQGGCGGCWAFSTVAALESHYKIKTKKTVTLSEQNLIDCSKDDKYRNNGCSGGYFYGAYQYVIDHGVDILDYYRFTGEDGKCKYNPKKVGVSLKSFHLIDSGKEDIMKSIVAQKGPISVAIDASPLVFIHYSNGVYDYEQCSSTNLNHGVLVVGYGNEGGRDYWLIKNSWGKNWGIKGYGKIARNKNMCGIATLPYFPDEVGEPSVDPYNGGSPKYIGNNFIVIIFIIFVFFL